MDILIQYPKGFSMKKTMLLISVLAIALATSAMAVEKKVKKTTISAVEKTETVEVIQTKKSAHANKLEVEPQFNMAFTSPKDINDMIRDGNDTIQKAGFKNFSVPQFGSAAGFGVSALYRAHEKFAIGLGWSHLESTVEGSATTNGSTLNGKYAFRANLLTLDTKIILLQAMNGKFEGYLAPQIGVGFYGSSIEMSGSALAAGSSEVLASASGFVWGSTAGARYWILDNVSAGMFAGYRSAQSGNLKIDSVRNAPNSGGVGQDADNNGKKIKLDTSAFLLGAAVNIAI